MTVSVLSIAARSGDEIAVTFEIREGEHSQRECFLLSAAAFADLRLSVGECDRSTFDAVSSAAELYRAIKKGLSILSFGACSEKALYRKLVTKGIEKETAKRALKALAADGYMNDREGALREAERCVAKRWGERRIAACLYEKGYSEGAAKEAIYALLDGGVDFAELCAERLRDSVDAIPDDPKERQRLTASLMRYGFSASEIRDAMRNFNE